MELTLTTLSTDLSYTISFMEAQLSMIHGRSPLELVEPLLKNFSLRLNDLKFNNDSPSNNFIHFSKFYEQTFLDVSFGFEELKATIRNPGQREQVRVLLGALSGLFNQSALSVKHLLLQRQLQSEGDTDAYLKSLNPNCPEAFVDLVTGRGISLRLNYIDPDLTIYISVVTSFYVQNGLYLSLDFHFAPNQLSFNDSFDVIESKYAFILRSLNLKIEGE